MLSTNPRPWFCFGSPDKTYTNNKTKQIKHKRQAKRAAGIEGQMAKMIESHTEQINTTDTAEMKGAKKNNKIEQIRGDKTEVPPSNEITGKLQLFYGRPTLALSSALVPQTLNFSVCVEDS